MAASWLEKVRTTFFDDPDTATGGYEALTSQHDVSCPWDEYGAGVVVFKWNGRDCKGTALHSAVLKEDFDKVAEILDAEPSALFERFSYETKFAGKVQEGSGEAIHLAVTRSSVPILQLLVERNAALDSMVTRDCKPHYDVLHSAVFSEGRGGQLEVIRCLLEAKAPPTKNLDGHYPLHKAFQTGACVFDAIPLLSEDMQQRGLLEDVEKEYLGPVKTPLQLGIYFGKLTGEQLAQVASMTPVTLKIFLHDEPHSIPPFFDRMQRENYRIPARELAEYVTLEDLIKCLREHPQSADVLLNALTDEPEVDNPGWHPLPTRMSFGPRGRVEKIRNWFNPPRVAYYSYQRACKWEFDATSFTAPDWHQEVTGQFGRPIGDVGIKVCYLPEIVKAEFLGALLDADYGEIFQSLVVRSSLNSVWWGGAYKLDILQLCITALGIFLLVVDRAQLEMQRDGDPSARMLTRARATENFGNSDSGRAWSEEDSNMFGFGLDSPIADSFVCARGVADLLHELAQFGGNVAMGRGRSYFTFNNLFDVFRALLAISFHVMEEGHAVQVLLIVIYWGRLLEVSFSENLMRELLPITQLAQGLAPSLVVCLIAMCAFTHAKWVMHQRPLWPDTCYESFSLLLTAGLPAENSSNFALLFAYFAVSCFSVFFLNIFISVISENYSIEKEQAPTSFQKKKCKLCLTFMTRAKVLPCSLWSRTSSFVVVCISGVVVAYVLIFQFFKLPFAPMWPMVTLVIAQIFAMVACYQDLDHVWTSAPLKDGQSARYMWICRPLAKEVTSQVGRIEESVGELRAQVQELQEMLAPKRENLPKVTSGSSPSSRMSSYRSK